MILGALFFSANMLIFSTFISYSAAGEEEEAIDWGSTGCTSDSDCPKGHCCVKKESGGTDCEQLSSIGQHCSPNDQRSVLSNRCPCQQPFFCNDKSEGVHICETERYSHF
uniref:Putative hainantoxin-xiv n=1 Tax=Amblyomma triste TaxID=251400 RepID=A0A023G1Z0_AMBTT